MYELIEELAEKIASKHFLNKEALLNKNQDIMYLEVSGDSLLEVDRHTHLSKCISKDPQIINLFNAIQTLLNNI